MTGTVPALSIVCMAASCLVAFALPIGLFVYFRRVKKADVPPFFVGCAVMLVFALILESAVHRAVLSSAVGETIQNNLWLYALYGGLMAGLFEETGRFAAFKTVLRKYRDRDVNALMYGAGHGGFEAAALLGVAMLNNIVYSVMINAGNAAALTDSLSGDALAQTEAVLRTLTATPPYQFLLGGAERVLAVILHISLSVLVWFAAKERGRWYLYPLAVLLHALTDAAAVVLSGLGVSALLVEAAVGALAAFTALCAKRVWTANI